MLLKELYFTIKIFRPLNLLIIGLTYLLGCIIAEVQRLELFLISPLISLIIAATAGYIINDIFDIEIDSINKPDRALPNNPIIKKKLFLLYSILVFSSLGAAVFTSINVFLLILGVNILLLLYSAYCKGIPLLGNVVVALLTTSPLILVGIEFDSLLAITIPAVFAFFVTLIREIVKDIEDIEGDAALGLKTFPIKFGKQKAVILIKSLLLILIILTIIPFFIEIYKIEYLIFVLFFVDTIYLSIIKKITDSDDFAKHSKYLKVSIFLGLISIFIGL